MYPGVSDTFKVHEYDLCRNITYIATLFQNGLSSPRTRSAFPSTAHSCRQNCLVVNSSWGNCARNTKNRPCTSFRVSCYLNIEYCFPNIDILFYGNLLVSGILTFKVCLSTLTSSYVHVKRQPVRREVLCSTAGLPMEYLYSFGQENIYVNFSIHHKPLNVDLFIIHFVRHCTVMKALLKQLSSRIY